MDPALLFAYHRDMLADEKRLAAYREAISRIVRPEHVVVDLGAGTGVLSVYAARAGARRVYALDRAVPAGILRAVIEENGVSDRVTVIAKDSRQVQHLPELCDILVADIGLDEESLLDARRRFLRPGGVTIPRQVILRMAPVQAPVVYERAVDFWQRAPGAFQVAAVRRFAANQVHRTSLENLEPASDACEVFSLNIAAIESPVLSGTVTFTTPTALLVHGFAGWTRVEFAPGLSLENAPPGPPASWRHLFFPLERPVSIAAHDQIELTVIKRGLIWIWRGRCGGERFEHSTFQNVPMTADEC